MNEWKQLIERYADGKPICNCRQAYYEPCGHGSVWDDGLARYVDKTDLLACRSGCEVNVYRVRDYIAQRVLADLKPPT